MCLHNALIRRSKHGKNNCLKRVPKMVTAWNTPDKVEQINQKKKTVQYAETECVSNTSTRAKEQEHDLSTPTNPFPFIYTHGMQLSSISFLTKFTNSCQQKANNGQSQNGHDDYKTKSVVGINN